MSFRDLVARCTMGDLRFDSVQGQVFPLVTAYKRPQKLITFLPNGAGNLVDGN
jgi:hypothetical protein